MSRREQGGGVVSVVEFYRELGVTVPSRGSGWVDVKCFNPDHDHDHTPSCGVNVEHGGFRCQACGAKGSAYDAAVLLGHSNKSAAALCMRHGLGKWDGRRGRGSDPPKQPRNRATVSQDAGDQGCTVDQYADAKQLPAEFLRKLGISDYVDSRWPNRVLRIPYIDVAGKERGVRIRCRLTGPDRVLWRKGSKPTLYGLPFLSRAREQGYAVLVEGESDCHTLWHHGFPALGLPGANTWNDRRDAQHFDGIERIYVLIEPDQGGDAVLRWLADSAISDRAWLIRLSEHKDPSELHLADPDRFPEHFQAALDAAESWRSRVAAAQSVERDGVWARCADLATQRRILDSFSQDAVSAGLTGERKTAQLVYLIVTSRLLDRLASLVVKGQSSSGKSWIVQTVLRFFPDSAYYALTAASERALIYDHEPLEHRVLVIYEASGLESETFSYIVRSLLSEGRLRYPTVVKQDGELTTVMIEREGPTSLITTTTAHRLHSENETRLLSVTSDDSAKQTAAVFMALAEEDADRPDLERWHALQRWLELGAREVTIPYAKTLATKFAPAAPRLRRDFGSLLALIRAHALLHQATRKRDRRGRIIALIEDYAVVRGLLEGIIAEGVEKTVKPEVREIVAAVDALIAGEMDKTVTQRQLVAELKLDKGSVSRRVNAALNAGYLINREERRGRPHRLAIGDPLPDNLEILPPVEELHGCTVDEGDSTPPPPAQTNVPAGTKSNSTSDKTDLPPGLAERVRKGECSPEYAESVMAENAQRVAAWARSVESACAKLRDKPGPPFPGVLRRMAGYPISDGVWAHLSDTTRAELPGVLETILDAHPSLRRAAPDGLLAEQAVREFGGDR